MVRNRGVSRNSGRCDLPLIGSGRRVPSTVDWKRSGSRRLGMAEGWKRGAWRVRAIGRAVFYFSSGAIIVGPSLLVIAKQKVISPAEAVGFNVEVGTLTNANCSITDMS